MKYSSGVTMATVARAADVARSTVSKALREDPSISPARRREIQRVAKSLGYRPNPMVAALMARLHSHRRRNDPHHLAWIDLWPDDREAARTTDFKLMLRGAKQRAAELGYQIEVHHVGRDGTSAARLHQILIARSHWGLIIPPVPREAMAYPLDLEGLTGVTIGTSLHQPVMHRVASNLFQGSQLAAQKLRERGFHRIGFVLSPALNERVEKKWLGAFLAEQAEWPRADRLPPLLVTAEEEARFLRWFERFKPDVIVFAEQHVENWIAQRRSGGANATPVAWLRRIETTRKGAIGIDTRPEKWARRRWNWWSPRFTAMNAAARRFPTPCCSTESGARDDRHAGFPIDSGSPRRPRGARSARGWPRRTTSRRPCRPRRGFPAPARDECPSALFSGRSSA